MISDPKTVDNALFRAVKTINVKLTTGDEVGLMGVLDIRRVSDDVLQFSDGDLTPLAEFRNSAMVGWHVV